MFETFMTSASAPWAALVGAGLFEIGWPLGLRMAQSGSNRILGAILAVAAMGISGLLLWFAQKTIPMGTAYAVWTGIGAAGTFAVGALFFGESINLMRFVGVGLIISGVICLKAGH
jgi:quaternary ammonium compound-resistance protein SugE